MLKFTSFLYHPDPLATGSFDDLRSQALSILWEKKATFIMLLDPIVLKIEHHPTALNGQAKKIRAIYQMPSGRVEWIRKESATFCPDPRILLVGRGEYWLSCCQDCVLT